MSGFWVGAYLVNYGDPLYYSIWEMEPPFAIFGDPTTYSIPLTDVGGGLRFPGSWPVQQD